ncbi:hypothetical protein R2601_19220 [Salipiger bermudensis HTCC2601]|uniref:Uncharacterized protein n=1 Tax=Salipiger bermudensis (strain DSM 26914 / JCM 13377 / KCTC 12554 / HTCC2601) TaxID=314265 RepID=Q0FQR0_SALBH|nr:hypothetical protein R2601_19220 [Salipiger bermudensis HTCC2601]
MRRRQRDGVLLAHEDAAPIRAHGQNRQRRELMIDARTQKPGAEDQRRRNVAQALVEIGAVLLGNVMHALRRDLRPVALGQRIEVADHGVRQRTCSQQGRRATVCGHPRLAPGQKRGEMRFGAVSAAHQKDRLGASQDGSIHGKFTAFSDRGHNGDTK